MNNKLHIFTDEDMAAVGRATMAAIEAHADVGWAPADCPSEIIGDLRNQRDEMAAALQAEQKRSSWMVAHQHAIYDSENGDYSVNTWLSSSEPGNADSGGHFLARGKSFGECIDRFLRGDITRID